MAMHGSHLQAGDVTGASRPRAKSVRGALRSALRQVPLGGAMADVKDSTNRSHAVHRLPRTPKGCGRSLVS